ncbi:rRNA (cytosine-C5-)-methyltransferase [Aureococcus anophagefferens]|nr:rRNA (cytosine-C5-)-methyltransferase [Aureococcus anophagefferens]
MDGALVDDQNPTATWGRIQENLGVLGHFKERAKKGKARAEYLRELGEDLTSYYGYLQELTELFLTIFSPSECTLIKRGVHLEPMAAWSKVALKITESSVPVGATPEYLAGHYMLQSAASQCPVLALGPEPGERVLELAAAPGGKSSYCAQLMKNSGTLVCNDLKKERHKATVANLHRLGVSNAVVCCHDGRAFPGVMGGFDRVLLDAPCTGLGVISRDQSIKGTRTLEDGKKLAHLQKELILAAIDSVDDKKAGVVVYSTCSVAVLENEDVVQYADKRNVKLVDAGLPFACDAFVRCGQKRYHPSMALARRFYPHTHNMDGFFVAKLQKLSPKDKQKKRKLDE